MPNGSHEGYPAPHHHLNWRQKELLEGRLIEIDKKAEYGVDPYTLIRELSLVIRQLMTML